mgnify:CR=1 FL=1
MVGNVAGILKALGLYQHYLQLGGGGNVYNPAGEVRCGFWGGYPGAERALFYALPGYLDPEDADIYPVRGLTIRFPLQLE